MTDVHLPLNLRRPSPLFCSPFLAPKYLHFTRACSTERQTLFFTATWPKEVRRLASEFLSGPVVVSIGDSDQLAANRDVTQIVHVIGDGRGEKEALLQEVLRTEGPGARVVVFCSTKRMCDQLERSLARSVLCAAIHGDKDQNERNRTLSDFKVPCT